jgi:DNA-binding NarL/FixJ family response regulator
MTLDPIIPGFLGESRRLEGRLHGRQVWDLLSIRAISVVSSYCTEEHCCLEVRKASPVRPDAQDLQVLARVLLGESQKAVALDLRCAPSTVATRTSSVLRRMGFTCTARSVPTALIMMAHATRSSASFADVTFSLAVDYPERGALRIARPRTDLGELVTASERHVLEMIVEGAGHREIARRRGCSMRTIANQIAALHRKFGVSGRISLIGSLLERNAMGQGCRPPPTLSYPSSSLLKHGLPLQRATAPF